MVNMTVENELMSTDIVEGRMPRYYCCLLLPRVTRTEGSLPAPSSAATLRERTRKVMNRRLRTLYPLLMTQKHCSSCYYWNCTLFGFN